MGKLVVFIFTLFLTFSCNKNYFITKNSFYQDTYLNYNNLEHNYSIKFLSQYQLVSNKDTINNLLKILNFNGQKYDFILKIVWFIFSSLNGSV